MAAPEIVTFGCRLNAYESEVMRTETLAAGVRDAIVFNTCAVTAEAERQARQAIRRARRERPNARIIVTGCAAQIDPEGFAAMPEVDLVLGNAEKLDARHYWPRDFGLEGEEKIKVNDITSVGECAHHMIDGFGGRVRAFVQIQNGCNHRCTFCIIPFGRGASRSVAPGPIVEQIQRLVELGTAEVVLTGVDITAYGADLPGRPSLGGLVRRILKLVPELKRLRLSSLDTIECDEELIRAVAEEERLMPHFHLSLQAGDDTILKRMKRRHSHAQAVAFCERVRVSRPEAQFGADLIAGFPTETEEMFRNTLALVEDCGLVFLHVFPFSPRPGTPAARMPQLDRSLVRERAQRVRAAGARLLTRFLAAETGKLRTVLFETSRSGRTPQYANVTIEEDVTPGVVRDVAIRRGAEDHLEGRLAA